MVVLSYGVLYGACLVSLLYLLVQLRVGKSVRETLRALPGVLQSHAWLVSSVVVGGVFLAMMIGLINFLPRYTVMGFPFVLTGLCWFRKRSLLRWAVIGAVLFVNVLDLKGGVSKRLSSKSPRNNGHILERSLEFEDDLFLNRGIARYVEEHHDGRTIKAPWPLAHALLMPEVGYVDASLPVCSQRVPALSWRASDEEGKWLGVHVGNIFPKDPGFDETRDRFLKRLQVGPHSAIVFERTASEWAEGESPGSAD